MAKFSYIVIQAVDGKLVEYHGIIDALSLRDATMSLTEMDYYVRDVRPVSELDIRIDSFKRLRRIIRGDRIIAPIAPVVRTRRFNRLYVISALLVLLLILWIVL